VVVLTLNMAKELPFEINGYALPAKGAQNERSKDLGANHNQVFRLLYGITG